MNGVSDETILRLVRAFVAFATRFEAVEKEVRVLRGENEGILREMLNSHEAKQAAEAAKQAAATELDQLLARLEAPRTEEK